MSHTRNNDSKRRFLHFPNMQKYRERLYSKLATCSRYLWQKKWWDDAYNNS